jgi:hypothetical protein
MSRRAPSPKPAGSASGKAEKFTLDPEKADAKKYGNPYNMMFASTVIPNLLFAGITFAGMFYGGSVSKFSRNRVKTLADRSAGPLLLGLWLLNLTHAMVTALVMDGRASSGCNPPDQYVYKVMSTGELVLMDDDGANGQFNRAQRGLHSMAESAIILLIALLPVAFVFPWTAAGLVVMLAYSRWSFASGYVMKREKRTGGFMLMVIMKEATFGMVLFLGVYATYLELKVYYPELDIQPGLEGLNRIAAGLIAKFK